MSDEPLPQTEIILYQTEDGRTRIQCRFENETVWLTQALLAELFQKDVRTINEHLVNIFEEGELRREATIRKFRMVRVEGRREVAREIEHYNLDAILAVGLLDHAGKISAGQGKAKAEIEYAKYRALLDASPRPVDADFEKATSHLKKLPPRKKQP